MLLVIVAVVASEITLLLARKDHNAAMADGSMWLGIEAMELNPAVRAQYDIRSSSGLLVSRVFAGSPAEVSGVRTGDVIRKWRGKSITSLIQFEALVACSDANEEVRLTVDRDKTPLRMTVQLGSRPGSRQGG